MLQCNMHTFFEVCTHIICKKQTMQQYASVAYASIFRGVSGPWISFVFLPRVQCICISHGNQTVNVQLGRPILGSCSLLGCLLAKGVKYAYPISVLDVLDIKGSACRFLLIRYNSLHREPINFEIPNLRRKYNSL